MKRLVREAVEYKRNVPRVFSTDRIRSFRDKKNSLDLDSGDVEKG